MLAAAPILARFVLSSEIGRHHGVGPLRKIGLVWTFHRNIKKLETLSDLMEHVELASCILRLPPEAKGDVVECGCYLGGSSVNLSIVCGLTGRRLLICDSFEGLPEPSDYDRVHVGVDRQTRDIYYKGRFAAPLEIVRDNLTRYGDVAVCDFEVGFFDRTMPGLDRPVVMAFLDVDLIDSLKPCLLGIWPQLHEGGRVYVHEAQNLPLVAVMFDQVWWQAALGIPAPGFVGSGVGLPLAMGVAWGSELGYAQKGTEAALTVKIKSQPQATPAMAGAPLAQSRDRA